MAQDPAPKHLTITLDFDLQTANSTVSEARVRTAYWAAVEAALADRGARGPLHAGRAGLTREEPRSTGRPGLSSSRVGLGQLPVISRPRLREGLLCVRAALRAAWCPSAPWRARAGTAAPVRTPGRPHRGVSPSPLLISPIRVTCVPLRRHRKQEPNSYWYAASVGTAPETRTPLLPAPPEPLPARERGSAPCRRARSKCPPTRAT